MTKLYFSKDPSQRLASGASLELPDWSQQNLPEQYVIEDNGLVAAINAALILGQPLLLTGEPGTGKTSLAARIAWQLGLSKPLIFETKSNSIARDLFYTYDAVGRFQAAHGNQSATSDSSSNNLPFIAFQALGKAIILTGSADPKLLACIRDHEVGTAKSGSKSENLGPQRAVVLIDEIDKAHRDFPNDLLNEIDRMSFTMPELQGQRVVADPKLRPIVVITSNSEKNLPDPFLRRCVYYHIDFPEAPVLQKILQARIGPSPSVPSRLPEKADASASVTTASEADSSGNDFIASAVSFFLDVRGLQLRKVPATAELVGWARLLLAYGAKLTEPISKVKELAMTLSALAKNQDDLETLHKYLQNSQTYANQSIKGSV